jgi:phenylpyruvate tautomerase PptA (4-oxalocrotonate tautomerase family)
MTEAKHSLVEHVVEAMPKFLESFSKKKETHVAIEGAEGKS